ncbi:hypothetical protein CAEBREN_01171 [Caenorhabditis brenneri]|uniref:Uncharacterized protein n=1 Tax=Caenorhabditis brenneri TaxID=135651 RepID=G0N878_CAEBE|nr:hypothetical protein CAEBREN_01171 [Caenorhabditis brenneri]
MPHVEGELSNGTVIKSNLHELNIEEKGGNQYFLVDSNEMEAALKEQNKNSPGIHLIKFEDFAEKYKNTFYIRVIRKENTESERIFAEEVLNMIPVALKKQGAKVDKAAFQRLRCKWGTVDGIFKTMSEEELNKILEKFDIDKSKITLVPDPIYEYDFLVLHRRSGIISFKTRSPNNIIVMDPLQAAFYTLQHLLLQDVNRCENKNQCKEKTEKAIIELMEEYMNMDPNIFISMIGVSDKVDDICSKIFLCKECAIWIERFFEDKEYSDLTSTKAAFPCLQGFHYTKFPNFLSYGNKESPVWMATMFIAGTYFQTSYLRQHTNLRNFLSLQFNLIVPPEVLSNEFYLDFKKHVSTDTEEPWPTPGSEIEKRMKRTEVLGITFEVLSTWIEDAEKQWQLSEDSLELDGFPELPEPKDNKNCSPFFE